MATTSRVMRTIGALLFAASVSAQAQSAAPRKSQLATVSQQVAGARLEVVYRRPVARGRVLFGTLVPWGKVWTPSADTAARLSVSAPVTINGSPLAAGTYSVWTIPDSSSWTVIFSSTATVFHMSYPGGHDVLRVRATPLKGDHVESLQFAFPIVDADSAQLELRWGTTIVPLSVHVTPRTACSS